MATRVFSSGTETGFTTERSSPLLFRALAADSLASGAVGAVILPLSGWLDGHLGLPVDLLRGAGVVMLVWAAIVGVVATRTPVPPRPARAIIVLNFVWVVASVALLISGAVEPTALGYAFVIGQAAAVVALTELQWVGLRRERSAV